MAAESGKVEAEAPTEETYSGLVSCFVCEVVKSPVNLALVAIILLLVYKIFKSKTKPDEPVIKTLPKMRRDFTVEELKEYNGTGNDGRILLAINGNVYDVTKGDRFYGPGKPYAAFGGRDASRGLATFSVVPGKDDYDDLSDLNTDEMNSVKEWEEQFKAIVNSTFRTGVEVDYLPRETFFVRAKRGRKVSRERYEYVGKLLKPGEAHTNYSDEEEEGSQQDNSDSKLKSE